MLKSYFPPTIKYNWIFGIVLILIFTSIRFYMVMDANITQNYGNVSILFTIMAILPFLILNKDGRKFIGIVRPKSYIWLLVSLLAGIIICTVTYLLFKAFYGHGVENSLVYISQSYAAGNITSDNKFTFFIIYAISSMIFSPIGEEVFYRGVVHGSFVGQFGENNASRLDSLAFAVAHLSHFGVVYISGNWSFLFLPALLWGCCMYVLCRISFLCKQKTGSILGSIFTHAGFNLAMIYWIFYHIL